MPNSLIHITIKDSVLKKIKVPVSAELRKRKSDIKNTYIAFDGLDEEAYNLLKVQPYTM